MKRNEILDEWVKVFRSHFDIELVRRHRNAANGMYVDKVLAAVALEFAPAAKRREKRRKMARERLRGVKTSGM